MFETERARAAVGGALPEEKLRDREVWRSIMFSVRLSVLIHCMLLIIFSRLVSLIYEPKRQTILKLWGEG